MTRVQFSAVPVGTVIEVKNREHLEKLIFGDNKALEDDQCEFYARKSFLDSVEDLMRQGDGRLVKL